MRASLVQQCWGCKIKEKELRIGFLLIRMFVVGTGVPDGPQNTNFGRDIVFSADLCDNGTNEKREVARRSRDGRSLRDLEFIVTRSPSVSFADSSLPEGAYGRTRASLGVWVLPDVCVASNAVIQRRNWR